MWITTLFIGIDILFIVDFWYSFQFLKLLFILRTQFSPVPGKYDESEAWVLKIGELPSRYGLVVEL